MQRDGLLLAWLAIALVCGLLLLESELPGHLLVPLTPDDFPAWQAGRDVADLQPHPHPNWCMSDVLHLLIPGLATTRAALDRGELPRWDPTQACGVPHIDEVHYGVYYPPAWIPLVLGLRGLAPLAWLHLLVAGSGMLLYLRSLRRTTTAALTGALAFALSAWITARLQNFSVVGAAVWLPWVLWGLERAAQDGRRRHLLVAAVAFALSLLAGFPQVSALVAGVAVLLELVRALAGLRHRTPVLRPAGRAALALVVGGLLAAPQLLPTADYLVSESARAEVDLDVLAAECLEPPLLAHLILPDYYASAGVVGFHPLALAALDQAQAPAAANRAETSMGIGLIGLLLAVAAMLFGRTWQTRVWTGVVLGTFALLLWPDALRACASVLPPLRLGNPKRLLLLSTAGLAVLAAGGVDLLRRRRLRVTVICWSLSLALAAAALVALVEVPTTEQPADVDAWAERLATDLGQPGLAPEDVYALVPRANFVHAADAAFRSALLAVAFGAAAILVFRPRSVPTERGWVTRAERAPRLLTVLVALELGLTALPLLRAAPADAVTPDPGSIGALRVPELAKAARELQGDSPVPVRLGRVGDAPSYLRPDFPGLFGLQDVQAYAPMLPRRLAELLATAAPACRVSGSALGGFGDGAQLASPLVDLLGVGAVLTNQVELAVPGLEPIAQVGEVKVLANTEVLPRAFCVDELRVVRDPAQRLAALGAPDFEPLRTACLEAPLAGLVVAPGEGAHHGTPEPPGRQEVPAVSAASAGPGADADVEDPEADATPPAPGAATAGAAVGDAPGAAAEDPQDLADAEEAAADQVAADQPPDGVADQPQPAVPAPDTGVRTVTVESYAPGHLRLAVGAGPPALLIVSECFHDGWRATVGGHEVTPVRADHALLGVPLADRGEQGVDLVFHPLAQDLGLALGGLVLLVLVAGALRPWRWVRRRGAGAGEVLP